MDILWSSISDIEVVLKVTDKNVYRIILIQKHTDKQAIVNNVLL
jgi:hypothetical protein